MCAAHAYSVRLSSGSYVPLPVNNTFQFIKKLMYACAKVSTLRYYLPKESSRTVSSIILDAEVYMD